MNATDWMELRGSKTRTWEAVARLGIVLGATGLVGCGASEETHSTEAREAADALEGALRDRRPPTTPGNFRVTATTPFSASLEWSPSTDDSGNFTYHLTSTVQGGGTVTLPKTATSYVWSQGLAPRNYYSFIIYAKDAAGNASPSTSVMARLPRDTVAPAAPVVSVVAVGSTYVKLEWTAAVDDGPFLFYEVWKDGSRYSGAGTNRAATVFLLEPETTYSLAVRAYDYGPNYSPLSASVTVTTRPVNPLDTTPPTTPTNLDADVFGTGDGETHLRWISSTDDFDPQDVIRYDVYVNGVLSDRLFGNVQRSIVYGTVGIENQFDVIASDTAGNASAPATVRVFIP